MKKTTIAKDLAAIGDKSVASYTEAEKAWADSVYTAAVALDKQGAGFWALLCRVITAGATFDSMEAAVPKLKAIKAYKSAKSVISKARKNRVPLMKDGKPRTRAEVISASNEIAKNKADKGPVAPESTKAPNGDLRAMTPAEIVAAAVGYLVASAKLREQFGEDLKAIAELWLADRAAGSVEAAQSAQDAKARKAHEKAQAKTDAKAKAAADKVPPVTEETAPDAVTAEVHALLQASGVVPAGHELAA